MSTNLILDDEDMHCAWCQRALTAGALVTMEGRLTSQFGALYCAVACLQAARAEAQAHQTLMVREEPRQRVGR
jgi:hypothetical protein